MIPDAETIRREGWDTPAAEYWRDMFEKLEQQEARLLIVNLELLAACQHALDNLGRCDSREILKSAIAKVVTASPATTGVSTMTESDHGLELALTLARDQLTPIASTLLVVRNIFDDDESPTSFELRHNAWCPDHELAGTGNRGTCACGLYTTLERLKDACHDLDQVKVALDRCIQSLSEGGRP